MRFTFQALVLTLAAFPALEAAAAPFAYVPNQGSNNVSVIDLATDLVVTNLKAGIAPVRVALHPTAAKAYVANIGSDRVTVINTTSNTVGSSILVGDAPAEILVSTDGSQVFTSNTQSSNVTVIATATEQVITNLPTAYNCRAIAWVSNSVGNRVYVGSQGNSTVTIINPQTLAVDKVLTVGSSPRRIAVTPDGSRAYVTNYGSDDVSVIDTVTRTVVTTIPVGDAPRGVAITPDGQEIWVTNLQGNSISVISRATDAVITNLPAGILPWTPVFNRAGTRAYVLNSGNDNVMVYDVATRTLLKTIPVGSGPFWAEFNADGSHLYVTTPPDGAVSVIDTASDTNIATIATGLSAWVIAIQNNTPVPPPALHLDRVDPNSANRGTVVNVGLFGVGFVSGSTVAFTGNGGRVTVLSTSFVNATNLNVSVNVQPNARRGGRTVNVANPDGQTSAMINGFQVR